MIQRRTVLAGFGTLAASAALLGIARARTVRIAIVAKSLGNGFFNAVHLGGEQAAKSPGGIEIIFTGPTDTAPEHQIDVINDLVAQHVDAIAISANDPDALVPVCKRAMQRGIKVISYDSGVAPAGRMLDLADAAVPQVGIVAAAKAVDDVGRTGKTFVTGLGLPSECIGAVEKGTIKSFAIWNPVDIGHAVVYTCDDLIKGGNRHEVDAGRLGSIFFDSDGGGTIGKPTVYDRATVQAAARLF